MYGSVKADCGFCRNHFDFEDEKAFVACPLLRSAGHCCPYGLSPLETLRLAVRSVLSADTLILVSNIYLITFLQRMMEHMGHHELAQKSLSGLFNNRRVNASVAPMFVGLLPSPGAIFIAGSMVNNACEDHLPVEDRAFIASYFRHISESFMPTYAFILFGCQLSGVPVNAFVLGMIPMVALLILLGYWFELRSSQRIPGCLQVTIGGRI